MSDLAERIKKRINITGDIQFSSFSEPLIAAKDVIDIIDDELKKEKQEAYKNKPYKVHIAGEDVMYCNSCDMVCGDGFYCRMCGQKLDWRNDDAESI